MPPVRGQLPIAGEGRQHAIVSKTLRPRLELLWCLATILPKQSQGLPEAVRIKVRQPRRSEGFLEDRADQRQRLNG